jgi:hypothetical protein
MFTTKRYLTELGAGLALYLLLLAATVIATHRWHMEKGVLYAVLLAPMIGVALMAVAVMRAVWRMDEMQRRIQLDAIAISFLATAVTTLAWGFVQLGGAPRMHPFAVWPMMAIYWVAGLLIARRRYI